MEHGGQRENIFSISYVTVTGANKENMEQNICLHYTSSIKIITSLLQLNTRFISSELSTLTVTLPISASEGDK